MSDPPARTVEESRSSVVRLMLPTDANFTGNVFGGALLSEMDRVAYVTATRHAKANCVTASFDRVDFLAPAHVGDLVDFEARLTYVGRSSMEVWVRTSAEAVRAGGEPRLIAQAFVTMVALDPEGLPTPVPGLALTSDAERSRFEEGRSRTLARRRARPAGTG